MQSELEQTLDGFTNIRVQVICGLTHTQVRIHGTSLKNIKHSFIADLFIYKKTQVFSIARIDTKDMRILNKICSVVSRFGFY